MTEEGERPKMRANLPICISPEAFHQVITVRRTLAHRQKVTQWIEKVAVKDGVACPASIGVTFGYHSTALEPDRLASQVKYNIRFSVRYRVNE